ncbi:MAG: metal-dependent transcriptional regulator [Candidatus Bathyarchaeia archaeon]
MSMDELSESAENYLKTIYRLMPGGKGYVKPKLLAEFMAYAPSTVTITLQRLAKKGYLEYLRYQGVRLTERGIIRVARILRAHRMCEVFFHDKLGHDLIAAHNEACRTEHVLSEDTINRLEVFLDYPKFCPHGNPIPDRNLRIAEPDDIPLLEAGLGKFIVSRIAFEAPEVLTLVIHTNIKPGADIEILKIDKINRVLVVQVKSQKQVIPMKFACVVMVKSS